MGAVTYTYPEDREVIYEAHSSGLEIRLQFSKEDWPVYLQVKHLWPGKHGTEAEWHEWFNQHFDGESEIDVYW